MFDFTGAGWLEQGLVLELLQLVLRLVFRRSHDRLCAALLLAVKVFLQLLHYDLHGFFDFGVCSLLLGGFLDDLFAGAAHAQRSWQSVDSLLLKDCLRSAHYFLLCLGCFYVIAAGQVFFAVLVGLDPVGKNLTVRQLQLARLVDLAQNALVVVSFLF